MWMCCKNKDFVEVWKAVEGIKSDYLGKLFRFWQYLPMRHIDIPSSLGRKQLSNYLQRLIPAKTLAFHS